MNEQIFKAYDIRGLYPSEISEGFAYALGRAVSLHFPEQEICVGRDCRNGSDKLSEALIKGITDQGSDAVDIGLCSTPVIYFASQDKPAVMVTASHNGKEYNGFKICAPGAIPLGLGNGLGAIKNLMLQGQFAKVKRRGKSRKRDIRKQYVACVRQFKGRLKKLKVVVDAGNGMAGVIAPQVFARLPVKIIPLFFEPDGTFPNRSPDPTKPESLAALSKAVRQNKAQLGIAYDGDCDRVIFVDEKGSRVRPDLALVLLARQLLKRLPHAHVLYDLTCSRAVKEQITALGGIPVMTRLGSTFISDVMRTEKALLAGEISGHYYFKDFFCMDNADIAALVMLTLLSEEQKRLSKLVAPLDRYFFAGPLSFGVDNKGAVLRLVEEEYADKGKVFHIDGLSVEFEDWWFNLRASNTENLLRLTVEAKTKAMLERKLAELKRLLR
jgi:phosphomannomutase